MPANDAVDLAVPVASSEIHKPLQCVHIMLLARGRSLLGLRVKFAATRRGVPKVGVRATSPVHLKANDLVEHLHMSNTNL